MRRFGGLSDAITARMRRFVGSLDPGGERTTPGNGRAEDGGRVERLLREWERSSFLRTASSGAVPDDLSYRTGDHSNSFWLSHNGIRLIYTVQNMPEWPEIRQLAAGWNLNDAGWATVHRAETGDAGSIVQHYRLAASLFGRLRVVPAAARTDVLRAGAGSVQWIPRGFAPVADPLTANLPGEQAFAAGVLDWLMRSQKPPRYLTDGHEFLAADHRGGAIPGKIAVTVSPLAHRFLDRTPPPVVEKAVRDMNIYEVVSHAEAVMPMVEPDDPLFAPISVEGLRQRLTILRRNGGRITTDDGPVAPE